MSLLRRLKGSKHFLKKSDVFLSNIDETHYFDLNQRDLMVYHIDSETEGTFSLTVKNDDKGDTVLDKVCDHYNLHSYKEYFGLKYTRVDLNGDNEILWLDSEKSVGKQLKDTNNVLTFRIKHFPGKPQNIESEHVRYLIFLQIRNYLLKGDLQLSFAEDIKLAAYAVQASLGDFDPSIHQGNYLADIKFLSRKSLKAEEKIMEMHQHDLVGKTPAEMELAFLELASKFDTYGAELIVVKTSKGVPINFGVSHIGIITYLHGTPANIAKIDMFPWNQIGKISYENKTLRVHFHTPDRENSEIIKKQVMVFKCNNLRICKHLWKFVLDQKAFFNFKRGVDVPKIKSSSRLFTFKSKFRFSGRCERELLQDQLTDSSLCNTSIDTTQSHYPDTTTSTAYNSLSRSEYTRDHNSSTLRDKNFKRRTFQPTVRSFVRPKHQEPLVSKSFNRAHDSNNNEIESKNETSGSKHSNGILLSSESIQNSLSKNEASVHLKKQIVADVEDAVSAHVTSTPHMMHKISVSIDEKEKKDFVISEVCLQQDEMNQSKKIIVTSESKEILKPQVSENEDIFYDHDYYRTKEIELEKDEIDTELYGESSQAQVFYSDNTSKLEYNSSINDNSFLRWQSLFHTKLKSLSSSILIIFSILFIFFFFLVLIEHWKCTSSASIIKKSRHTPSCNYQKTLQKLSNNFQFGVQEIMHFIFGQKRSLFSWLINGDDSLFKLDPFFEWFSSDRVKAN